MQRNRTWKSWLWFIITVGLFFLLGILTAGGPIPLEWKLIVTGVWGVITIIIGLLDNAGRIPSDTGPLDWWTVPHTLAGVVFGMWFMPLWVVLLIVILWEVFEAIVEGFGENEVFVNRAVDVGVAVVGWLIVVSIACAVSGQRFPLLSSQGAILS